MPAHASLNRIYRLVWSALHQTWVVASELARGRGKSNATPLISAALLASLAGLSGGVGAAPQGGQVVSGSGSISASGNAGQSTTTITQASDKLSINWQSFNVGTSETVNFVQPSASALAVNRILDTQGSQILGKINANGQVWLINPNGVLFGRDAQINVGGLLASTLNPDDASIGSTRSNFSGNSTAGVVNLGSINAAQGGYVALLGHSVSNQGSISAPGGTVALGAGSAVSLNFAGSKLLGLEVTSNQVNALAENGGLIQADGGQVLLSAGARDSLLASVVNNTGIIRADSVAEHNGKIVLSGGGSGVVSVTGTLAAAGAGLGRKGGTVQVLGDKVLLAPGASIDASGHSGGGTVLVGGDYQGSNASVQNASRVYVASDTSLKADATGDGDGGKVVVWADGDTRFAGSISARGGAQGGNGGFVEVSGKQDLNMQGQIDVAAPHGTGGNVLLDPQNIILSTAASSPGAVTNQAFNTPDLAFGDAPASGTYTVNIASVTGFNELFLQATNDITVSNTVAMGAGNSIRLEARNNIAVNAGITVTGAGSMNLRADADSSGAGGLTLTNAALSAQAGGITLRAASVTGNAASTISSTGAANGNAGNISITADTGSVALAASVTANGGTTTSVGRNAGNVTITAKTSIATATITASGSGGAAGNNNGGAAGVISLTNNTSGNITTAALTSQTGNATGTGLGGTAGSISVTNNASGGNVTTAALTTTGGTKGAGGNITVSAAAVLSTNGTAISSSGGAGLTSAGASAGNITLSGGTVTLGASQVNANGGNGGGTSFAGGNGGTISVTSNTGGMTSASTGTIRANGGIASGTAAAGGAGGTVTVTNAATSTGAINLAGALIARTGPSVGTTAALSAGSITVNNNATIRTATTLGVLLTEGNANGNGGQVNITATGTVALGGIFASNGAGGTQRGDVTILAGDTITQTSNIVTRNLRARTAKDGGAAITLTNTGNDAETVNLQALNGAGTANASAAISYTDATGFAISGINNGTGGTAGNVTLRAGGAVTQTSAVNAAQLTATLTGTTSALNLGSVTNNIAQLNAIAAPGGFTLTNGNNAVAINAALTSTNNAVSITTGTGATTFGANGSIASGGGNVTLTNTHASKVLGNINTTGGTDTGNFTITGAGAISQAASTALTIKGATAIAAGATNNVTLTNTNNDFTGAVSVSSGNAVGITDTNALVLGASTVSGTLGITAGGAVTQTGAIAATGLALKGTGGAYTLNHASNAITTLAANTGSINYRQSGALAVGNVGGVSGVTTTGTAQIETTGATANLTLNNAVTSGATGDAIILKAASVNAAGVSTGGQLINNVGTGGIVASSGRYLAYSGDPGSTTEGVTGYAKRYNADATFVPSGPASTFVYRIAPTLAITANAGSKVYDGAAPTLTFGTAGLIDGDTAGTALTGSLTRTGGKNVLGGDAVTIGTLAAQMGYGITYTGANYSINKANLTVSGITASDKTYDGKASATVSTSDARYSGLIGTDSVVVSSIGIFADKNAGTAKTVNLFNNYSGADVDNYAIIGQNTTKAAINRKALTISDTTAAGKTYDGNTTAAITVGRLSGFVDGEAVSATARGTFESKNAGSRTATAVYTLADGSGMAENYTLADTTHSATISKANLTYTANKASFNTGTTPASLSGTVSGFVNNESQSSATTGTVAWTTPATSASGAGSYAINGSGLSAVNYSFSQAVENAAALTLIQSVSIVPVVKPPSLSSDTGLGKSTQLAQKTTPSSVAENINTLPATSAGSVQSNGTTVTKAFGSSGLLYAQGNGVNLPTDAYNASPADPAKNP